MRWWQQTTSRPPNAFGAYAMVANNQADAPTDC